MAGEYWQIIGEWSISSDHVHKNSDVDRAISAEHFKHIQVMSLHLVIQLPARVTISIKIPCSGDSSSLIVFGRRSPWY